jgi:hypothetical protein
MHMLSAHCGGRSPCVVFQASRSGTGMECRCGAPLTSAVLCAPYYLYQAEYMNMLAAQNQAAQQAAQDPMGAAGLQGKAGPCWAHECCC